MNRKFFHWRATSSQPLHKIPRQELKMCQSKKPNGCAFETFACQGVVQIEALGVNQSSVILAFFTSHAWLQDFKELVYVNQMSLSVYN